MLPYPPGRAVTLWARSLASGEAIVGVLYITVIMVQLVGLYAASDIEQELSRDRG
ncbi:MAG: hypothetical protein R3272_07790 [Candidatus Promineifilaceae bacterium]|nr:hypothetical protein [Candidatus Promineifilaceae bacterium]